MKDAVMTSRVSPVSLHEIHQILTAVQTGGWKQNFYSDFCKYSTFIPCAQPLEAFGLQLKEQI